MPTPAATRTEITIAGTETPVVQCWTSRTSDRGAAADKNPQHAAGKAEQDGFHEELLQDVVPPGPDGHPQADLAGPLGDGNEHDVHDPHPAHHQRNGGHDQQQRPIISACRAAACTISVKSMILKSSSWSSRR